MSGTGYTVHTGSSEEFASGWDRIFGDKKKKTEPAKKHADKPKAKQKKGKKKAKPVNPTPTQNGSVADI